ncbi:hypothetical protein OIO90_006480 [Microbotryomycetes sp. JL221]|nr:hypothetical protein OIO90_006480 [Microbotryomycetes sp. JL221]
MSATNVNAPAPENPELVIRKLSDKITIFSAPFARFGLIPIGGRSTAIKLDDGSLWIVASTALTPSTLSTLQEMSTGGPGVRHLIAIDREHNMFVPQYAKAFPDAKLYVPTGVKENWDKAGGDKKQLSDKVAFVFGQGQGDPFDSVTNGEIKSIDFGKSHGNEDIAFLHTPTKTLIQADLMFNLPPTEQYSKSSKRSWFPLLSSQFTADGAGHKRLLNMIAKDKTEYSKCAKAVSAWDFDAIIPCHGEVITTGGKGIWNNLYAKFLK